MNKPSQTPLKADLPDDLRGRLAANEEIIWYGTADRNLVMQRTIRYWINVIIVMAVLTWYVHDSKGVWWWSTYNLASVCWTLLMVALAIGGTWLRHRMSSQFSLLLTKEQLLVRQPKLFPGHQYQITQWPSSAIVEASKVWNGRILLKIKNPHNGKTIHWATQPLANVDQGVSALNSLANPAVQAGQQQ